MKKILHVSKYYYPFRGGTEQIALDCVNSLKDIYEQKVICFNHKKGSKKDAIYGARLANLVYSGSHASSTVPMGPFLCLAMIISEIPFLSVSLL